MRHVNTTSARIVLALVVAMVLAGCGGGGSSDSSSGSVSAGEDGTTEASTGTSAEQRGSGEGADESLPGESKSSAGGRSANGGSHRSASSASGKQGPHIVQPKGKPEQAISPQERSEATVASMTLQSPAIGPAEDGMGLLPTRYTCNGEDTWPQLLWSGVPTGTAELAVYAMSVLPVEDKLFVDWAVAGLDPSLTSIETGRLPRGAIVGTNGFGKRGYSICPPAEGETYMFAVYALPQHLSLNSGFDAREARQQILDVSGNVGLLPVSGQR